MLKDAIRSVFEIWSMEAFRCTLPAKENLASMVDIPIFQPWRDFCPQFPNWSRPIGSSFLMLLIFSVPLVLITCYIRLLLSGTSPLKQLFRIPNPSRPMHTMPTISPWFSLLPASSTALLVDHLLPVFTCIPVIRTFSSLSPLMSLWALHYKHGTLPSRMSRGVAV